MTCAAHTLQLSIKDSLKVVEEYSIVSEKVRKIVGHFKHSNVATSALEKKQEQLEVKRERLVQSCPTRWNSTFVMCETFLRNRTPVFAVLSDRSITTADMAVKQRMSELGWLVLEEMITLLKPLQAATKVFCSENKVTLSAVRPVIRSLLDNHFSSKPLDTVTVDLFKSSISSSLTTRFSMDEPTSNPRTAQPLQISEFLDPRYKDLRAESDNEARHIRKLVLEEVIKVSMDVQDSITETETKGTDSDLDLIFASSNEKSDGTTQFEKYLSEPQIGHNLNPLEWWRTREKMYLILATLARKYLGTSASSASSERVFSTAGNIVTAKRSSLSSENVNLLVFIHCNRYLLKKS